MLIMIVAQWNGFANVSSICEVTITFACPLTHVDSPREKPLHIVSKYPLGVELGLGKYTLET